MRQSGFSRPEFHSAVTSGKRRSCTDAYGSNHDAGRSHGGAETQDSRRITEVFVEEAGVRREGITIAFHEVSREDYAAGGVLMADKE